MGNLIAVAISKAPAFGARIFNRLTGFPVVPMTYRAHWRIFRMVHKTILVLIEDSPRGERARRVIPAWLTELNR